MKIRQPYLLVLLALTSFSSTHASAVESPFAEIVTQPKGVFGYQGVESVDPASGSLVIKHVDVRVPGPNGMDITINRNYNTSAVSAGLTSTYRQSYNWVALGPGWSLKVAPRIIHGNYFRTNSTLNPPKQQYAKSEMAGSLCVGLPVATTAPFALFLQLPDGSQQQIFSSSGNTGKTKSNWKVSCINSNVTAISPDGIVYDFGNWNTDRQGGLESTSDVFEMDRYGTPVDHPLKQSVTYIDAKKATDPNGNWLTYEYQAITGYSGASQLPEVTFGPRYFRQPDKTYEKSKVLSKITSNDGRVVSLSYNANTSRLEEIKDNSGNAWRYTYLPLDANNSLVLSKVTLPTGETWQYQYQPGAYLYAPRETASMSPITAETLASRKIIGITFPTGGKIFYGYGSQIVSKGLRSGTSNNFVTYPMSIKREQIISRTLTTGESWKYDYTRGEAGQLDVSHTVGPEGTTTYKFMGAGYAVKNSIGGALPPLPYEDNAWKVGQLMELTRPDGSRESYTYKPREVDSSWFVLIDGGLVSDQKIWAADLEKKVVERDGATYTTSYSDYDAYGNPGSRIETGPNGGSRTTTLTYFNDPTKWIIGRLKDETAPDSLTARTFDVNGKVLSQSVNGVTTAYTYDTQGNLATRTVPGGGLYTYSNYKLGVPQAETRPEGIALTRVVDNSGNLTSETDGEGRTTSYTFDGLKRVTSKTPPVGNAINVVYAPTSRTITRGALVETAQYDPFGRTASITLGGITTRNEYDGLDRLTFTSDPGATTGTRYQYDALNRLTRSTNADGTYKTISYGAGIRTITDERGKVTTYTYRGYGSPDHTQMQLMSISAPESTASVTLTRNGRDQVTSVTQAGLTRTYNYNANGYLTSVTNPETGTTIYGRDIAGNITSKQVGASGITHYNYDGLNRLVSTIYPGTTPAITNTYNKLNKLLTSSADGGNRSFVYDDVGNLTQESLALDGKVFTAGYTYNANDQLSSTSYPRSNRVVNYNPDVLGRPTTVSGYVNNVLYWPSGLIKQITYGNGTVSSYEQNSRLWPTNFTSQNPAGGQTYLNSSYTYDGVGNLTSISDATDNGFSRTLGYDNINRLVSATGPWGAGSISYDGGGNLIGQTFGPSSLAYTYDASNRLSSVSGTRNSTYGYDNYANISSSQGNTYSYNDVPNLVCINCATPATKVEYSYDGINQRSAVTKVAGKAYEMHDSNGKQLIELDAGNLTEYFYLGDKRIAQQVSH